MMEMDKQSCAPKEAPPVLNKTSSDSRNRIIYDFKNDNNLKNMYIDSCGNVSMGKLFEDLDALAGNIAYTHVDDGACSLMMSPVFIFLLLLLLLLMMMSLLMFVLLFSVSVMSAPSDTYCFFIIIMIIVFSLRSANKSHENNNNVFGVVDECM